MTYKEALKAVKGGLEVYLDDYPELTYPIELHQMVIRALEKQVPRNLILTGDDIWRYKCPSCDTLFVSDTQEYLCCPNCGQAINWITDEK